MTLQEKLQKLHDSWEPICGEDGTTCPTLSERFNLFKRGGGSNRVYTLRMIR